MKKIAILGSGESGTGAALLAKREGFSVFVSDKGFIKDDFKKILIENEILFEEGNHDEEKILNASEIIKSPGIPDKAPIVKKALEKGIPVISEIEFAYRFCKGKIIAITGSNGKTTTTNLTYHLLKSSGLEVAIGGNVGFSFAGLLMDEPKDFYVLELSSFQLDGIKTFKPNIAILLNITPDHLDRYDYQMENYVASKFRITMNQNPFDTFIYNDNDFEIKKYLIGKKLPVNQIPLIGNNFKGNILSVGSSNFDMNLCSLKGPHNMFNATCAIIAAKLVGATDDRIKKGLDTFINAPHRLEFVANIKGVDYINDSKATNVDSVFWALKAMTKPTILILGGQDKGNDYSAIESLVKEKVKAIVCMGVDNSPITKYFNHKIGKIVESSSAQEAVEKAASLADSGDVVLLSPACASFDLFNNYEDRGNQFKTLVHQMLNI